MNREELKEYLMTLEYQAGYAAVIKYKDYIIKTSVIDERFNQNVHEVAVNNVLEKLNSENFNKILYSSIDETCITEVIDRGNKCCIFVIYKFIEGLTLEHFLDTPNATKNNMKKILWNIIKVLHNAYSKLGFTHYDLHLLNVIIKSNLTPVIIDYGSSHIQVNKGIGIGRIERRKIFNEPLWIHDILRLCSSLYIKYNYELALHYKKIELQDKIDWNEYYMDNLVEGYIHDEDSYRESLEDLKLSDDPEDLKKYINEQKQYKIDYNKLAEDNEELRRQMMNSNIKKIMPNRDWDFSNDIEPLLKFFIPNLNFKTMLEYHEVYKFFEPSDDMINKKYNYDNFLKLASSVLNN